MASFRSCTRASYRVVSISDLGELEREEEEDVDEDERRDEDISCAERGREGGMADEIGVRRYVKICEYL